MYIIFQKAQYHISMVLVGFPAQEKFILVPPMVNFLYRGNSIDNSMNTEIYSNASILSGKEW